MAKRPAYQGQRWDRGDVRQLRELTRQNTPTRLIAWKLKRSEDAIRSKASDEGISLKPTNQSPYNRRSK